MSNDPNSLHKLFTSRVHTPASTYIGESGRMFYREDTGELRLSDGITPGGLPIVNSASSENIVIRDSAYIISNTDFTILANALVSGFSIDLPATPANGNIFNIKKIDSTSNIVTINGNGHNIDGSSTIGITHQYNSVTLQYEQSLSSWNII